MGLHQCLGKVCSLRGLVPLFWWVDLDLLSLKGSAVSSAVFWGVRGLGMALGSLSASGQCCVTILLQGLAWGIWHCSLLTFGWGLVLVLSWQRLGELSLINVSWGQEFSGGPPSWTWVSHLGASGLTPYCSTKTTQATQQRRERERKTEKIYSQKRI